MAEIADAVEQFLGSYSNEELKTAGAAFLVSTLCNNQFSLQSSGIVFAGFGDDEYFPTVVDYETDGYIGDKIKIKLKDVSDISRTMSSCIRAFAQGDMVERFMNGVDTMFFNVIMSTFASSIVESCLTTLDKYGTDEAKVDQVRTEIQAAAIKAVEAISEDAQGYLDRNFSDPVIRMVALLPKDELAHLAESLVALTSLKRRVSSDAETVGGPVDVALISKGDGFVWIKRKHYFPSDLNHQFARNYMSSLVDGENDDRIPGAASGGGRPAKAGSGRRTPSRRKPQSAKSGAD